MKFGSVCSGIESASVAWNPLGWEAAFFAEIEKFPSAVLAHHYPEVPNLGDMTKFKEWPDYELDVLVGGTPCQSFSIAGLRKGLDDPRGNLALTFLAIVDKYKPKFVVWENVPGVISDQTGALALFLDGLEELGYILDIDILDSQFFGVPQRRRRVFVCAQSRESLLKAKTVSSALTISQCLAEIFLLTSRVLRNQLATELQDLAFDASEPKRSLMRRMKLFDLQKAEAARTLQDSLAVLHRSYEREQKDLELAIGKSGLVDTRISGDTRYQGLTKVTGGWREEFLNTEQSWNSILEDVLRIANECITSTCSNETTESKIFTCAKAMMYIAAPITQSMASSPSFWNAVSSISIGIREFTNYARSANSSLFTELEWVRNWGDFIGKAERADNTYSNFRTRQYGSEIFPIADSLSGDTPPRREKGQRVADSLTVGANQCLGRPGDFVEASTGDISHYLNAGGMGRQDYETETLIAHSLRAEGFDASEDGTGRGTPLVPVQPYTLAIRGRGDSHDLEYRQDGTSNALLTPNGGRGGIGVGAIAFDCKASGQNGFGVGEIASTMRSMGHTNSHQNGGGHQAVMSGMQVRRLTPTECARLQGFPDSYLDITFNGKTAADGPRYKALGNSMAVPCMAWIGSRIDAVSKITSIQKKEVA